MPELQQVIEQILKPSESFPRCNYCGAEDIFFPGGNLCNVCEGRFDDHEYDDEGERDADFI